MKKKNILLVEDDVNLGTILSEYLQLKKFEVDLCKNGDDGLAYFKKNNYDLCILDVMMPRKDGFTLGKEIRAINKNIPIIFLTAKSMLKDKIEGFNIGADDYITKPFNTEELILRITAILRRSNNVNSANNLIFNIGKYSFDYQKRLLEINRQVRTLTSKESELLKLLCENNNETLNRELALSLIWKDDNYFTSRSMDVYITKLRNYLKDDDSIEIVNIHGVGFKLLIN
ncbi:MAG: response regulator transcription factor [Ignavibacteriae bacterium]|nr:response regulator transcription factor [Ignavibacteriota bacterium]MCB0752109.1 response regulator transcription factor [Ignavibacteriota bacterium]MCB9209544.1 response regulator transcription factor [Ignavibacteriales bacterium]MCB9258187.1 response regulator transcription factor [Ignavibacteriales bacterium]